MSRQAQSLHWDSWDLEKIHREKVIAKASKIQTLKALIEPRMKPDIKTLLPRASKSFLEANPQLCGVDGQRVDQKPVQGSLSAPQARRGKMNNTELEFAFILEHQKRNDEISDWRFEGITLRWEGVKFTPDFTVFPSSFSVSGKIKMIEVKGPFIGGNRARAVERFRHARTHWTQFEFELWQRSKDGQWSQIR